MTHEPLHQPGDIVQLKSGSPLMTVCKTVNNVAYVMYHNTVTGLMAEFVTNELCLKQANTRPETVKIGNMGIPVAKSSL